MGESRRREKPTSEPGSKWFSIEKFEAITSTGGSNRVQTSQMRYIYVFFFFLIGSLGAPCERSNVS